MKYLPFATFSLGLLFVSCAGTDQPNASASKNTTRNTAQSEETPRLHNGMTKSQVIKAWGEPSGKDISSRGEIWVYGNQNALRYIPYAGPWMHVNTAKVMFGSDGRVKDFRNTEKGNVFSESEGRGGSRFSDF